MSKVREVIEWGSANIIKIWSFLDNVGGHWANIGGHGVNVGGHGANVGGQQANVGGQRANVGGISRRCCDQACSKPNKVVLIIPVIHMAVLCHWMREAITSWIWN